LWLGRLRRLFLLRCRTLGAGAGWRLGPRGHAPAPALAPAAERRLRPFHAPHASGGVALAAALSPLAGLQAAFDVELGSLAHIFTDDFRQAAEEHHPVPLGPFLLLTGLLVLPAVAGRQGDVGHRIAVGQIAHFRVTARVTDQDYFVDASGHFTLLG